MTLQIPAQTALHNCQQVDKLKQGFDLGMRGQLATQDIQPYQSGKLSTKATNISKTTIF